jgi:hypothetical protein
MSSHDIVVPLALLEGIHLGRLVDDFVELLTDREADDSAVQRLTPSAYPEDQEAAEAFAASTRDDLLDRRIAEAATVRAALVPFESDVESLTEDEAMAPRDLIVAEDDLDAWLRTLTAIWLGYRLEMLIQAADDADERRGR